jgi:flavin reductase (DIM6/NTAB) family NADH-FMN oxidoreductase RutF
MSLSGSSPARPGANGAGSLPPYVSSASIVAERPRVVVGLARHHHSWRLVEQAQSFVLHLLDETQLDLVWTFGLRSGRDVDKLAATATVPTARGSPRLVDALAWLECRVETAFATGDRSLFLAAVTDGRRERPGRPLTMQRLLQLAPADRLREMRAQLDRDALIDAAAIAAWRPGT